MDIDDLYLYVYYARQVKYLKRRKFKLEEIKQSSILKKRNLKIE